MIFLLTDPPYLHNGGFFFLISILCDFIYGIMK